tara:strand:- start:857 stop:1300 length:444 start_codon:yes stop_codon:yes gene_type:complete
VHITALIVSEYSAESCHWNLKQSLSDWLTANKIPALYGIDTRALTQRIRDHGAMLGKIIFPGDDEKKIVQVDPNKVNLVAQVPRRALACSAPPPRLRRASAAPPLRHSAWLPLRSRGCAPAVVPCARAHPGAGVCKAPRYLLWLTLL